MTRNRSTRSIAAAAIAVALIGACGDDAGPASQPPTTAPSTTVPATTAPATTAPTTTVPNEGGKVSPADLTAVETVTLMFVESLGRGDIEAAARVVGPVSEAQANAAGGLRSMLQQSTEGHGAWLHATDRTVTPIGVDFGLVAVVLEGTLRVEGTVERRIAVFPVRKAESAATWVVEPWAYDIHSGGSFRITNPAVDVEEWASVSGPLEVTVETNAAGTAWTSFDAQTPTKTELTKADKATMRPSTGSANLAMVLFQSGPTLYGSAFRVKTGDTPTTTTPTNGAKISLPFLSAATNAKLSECAAGSDAACDASQVPGVLDDGAFSHFHRQCDAGVQIYCRLFDNLVAAELRMHQREGS